MKKLLFSFLVLMYSTKLSAQFLDVTAQSGIQHTFVNNAFLGGGAAVLDYNNDGWEDLFFTGGQIPDKLYKNLGDGNFIDESNRLSKPDESDISSATVAGDFDNDGCIDIFVCNYTRANSDFVLRNNCEGGFVALTGAAHGLSIKTNSIGATLFDYNSDGLLDIYVIGHVDSISVIRNEMDQIIGFDHKCAEDILYINKGDFVFEAQTDAFDIDDFGCSLAVTTIPIPDKVNEFGILIANDFGPFITPNQFFVKNESDLYEDQAAEYNLDISIYGMGIAIGDIDRDNDLDYYITNLGENNLHQNQGNIFASEQSNFQIENSFTPDDRLTTGWGTFFVDVDNDRLIDLFVANGTIQSPEFIAGSFNDPNILFLNQGAGRFSQANSNFGLTVSGPNLNRGAVHLDYDHDGDQDILVTYINFEATTNPALSYKLYENISDNDNNWVQFKLESVENAMDAFGAILELYVNGNQYTSYKYSGGTHASQNSELLSFGLGSFEIIDSLVVKWPSRGNQTTHKDLPINQTLLINENKTGFEVLGCLNPANEAYNPEATINAYCAQKTTSVSDQSEIAEILVYTQKDELFLSFHKAPTNYSIQIYTLDGKLLLRERISNSRDDPYSIPLVNIPSGNYVVNIISDQGVYSELVNVSR